MANRQSLERSSSEAEEAVPSVFDEHVQADTESNQTVDGSVTTQPMTTGGISSVSVDHVLGSDVKSKDYRSIVTILTVFADWSQHIAHAA